MVNLAMAPMTTPMLWDKSSHSHLCFILQTVFSLAILWIFTYRVLLCFAAPRCYDVFAEAYFGEKAFPTIEGTPQVFLQQNIYNEIGFWLKKRVTNFPRCFLGENLPSSLQLSLPTSQFQRPAAHGEACVKTQTTIVLFCQFEAG